MTISQARAILKVFEESSATFATVTPQLTAEAVQVIEAAGHSVKQRISESCIHRSFEASGSSVIHKYTVPYGAPFPQNLPEPCQILHVGVKGGVVVFWVSVPFEHTMRRRYFQVVGTGQRFATATQYQGTVQDGDLVWHLIEHLNVHSIEIKQ